MLQWQIGKDKQTLEELEDIVRRYPWFAVAHKEIYLQMVSKGEEFLLEGIKRSSPYLYSREGLVIGVKRGNLSKGQTPVSEPKKIVIAPIEKKEREIFVVGGDYFGLDDYNEVKSSSNNVVDSFKSDFSPTVDVKVKVDKGNDHFADDEYCTETLAKIYYQQGCYKRALEVYEKLILLYPEKNTYFAALKEEIKKHL